MSASMRVVAGLLARGGAGREPGSWPRDDRPDALLLSRRAEASLPAGEGRAAAVVGRDGDLLVAVRSLDGRPVRVDVHVSGVGMHNAELSPLERVPDLSSPDHRFELAPGGSAQPMSGGRVLPLIAMFYEQILLVFRPADARLELVFADVDRDARAAIARAHWA